MTSQSSTSNAQRQALDEANRMMQAIARALKDRTNAAGQATVDFVHPMIEQGTELLGRTVAPIADLPFIKFATSIPGVKWLLAAVGQVNPDKICDDVEKLRQDYPLDTPEQLAQRVMVDTAWQAAKVGLITNIIPPITVMLLAIDVGAIVALQAAMIYRIAAIYGFSPKDASRRGEVLSIWALTTGSSGFLKSGLSILEILPGIGTAVGISTDAAIVYGVGFLACRYYETKQLKQATAIAFQD